MANLKDIKDVPVIESLTGDEKVLLNVNGSAKQVLVRDLKDISNSPIANSLTGGEMILVNVDGELKQIPANLIKNSTRQLFREWNFNARDYVSFIEENITEDISWITILNENVDFEIAIETYGDEEGIIEELSGVSIINKYSPTNGYYSDPASDVFIFAAETFPALAESLRVIHPYGYVEIISGKNLDGYKVETGGCIRLTSSINDYPQYLKSVKIYKITR